MTDANLPLGRKTDYPNKYSPESLFPISRADARESNRIEMPLPFGGTDIWNAWELTWLGMSGRPAVATAEIRIPAESPNLIESKSLKLYLNSFGMTVFESATEVRDTMARDLSVCTGADVSVTLDPDSSISLLDGRCIDHLDVECTATDVEASLLEADAGDIVNESLHTHLLRSLCPVTHQPDFGSLLITYAGPRIRPESLLRYIVSFREHHDFHEACVERIFVDITERCEPTKLSVYARYQRRGGIDINPFRSNFDGQPRNLRLAQQ